MDQKDISRLCSILFFIRGIVWWLTSALVSSCKINQVNILDNNVNMLPIHVNMQHNHVDMRLNSCQHAK